MATIITFIISLVAGDKVMAHDKPIESLNLTKSEWKKRLTDEQYDVLREDGTESSFSSPLNEEKRDGVYVCAGCGLELFHSSTKFKSGTGWPSFFRAISGHVKEKKDFKLIWPRTEYHCARCGGHQGHIFNDGPEPTGLRYCNNGVALKFIPKDTEYKTAVFAGGCFWCMEKPFDALSGVISTTSGYTGGHVKSPTYEQVSAGGTGHMEVLQVVYDPSRVDYATLLDTFWKNIDPLDDTGQFCDKGEQYKSAIFYQNEVEKKIAEKSLDDMAKKLDAQIATKIIKGEEFYAAEKYHQNYHMKNPIRYKFYRSTCGRDKRLKELWGGKN